MDKESMWILENLLAHEISAASANRMLRALELLRRQEQSAPAASRTSEQQAAEAEVSQTVREATDAREDLSPAESAETTIHVEDAAAVQPDTSSVEETVQDVEEAPGEISPTEEEPPQIQEADVSEEAELEEASLTAQWDTGITEAVSGRDQREEEVLPEYSATNITESIADETEAGLETARNSTIQDSDIHMEPMSRCSECGVVNPPDSVLCDSCGARLVKPPPSSTEPDLPPRLQYISARTRDRIPQHVTDRLLASAKRMEGQYRLVTAMFADVSGVSGMARPMPLDLHISIMSNCLNVMVDTIFTKYEGCISHITGDRVLAFFGAPRTHENDAERAVRAALDIRAGMRELHLDVSIGINTGMVHVGNMNDDLYLECSSWSSDIELASMLQDAASPGEIWVGFSACRLVNRRFDFGTPTDVIARGMAGPQKAYPLLGISDCSKQLEEIGDLEMVGEAGSSNVFEVLNGNHAVTQRKPYNILLVDYDVGNLDALERIFIQEYNVFSATSGEVALDIMAQNDVAVIIADHHMPDMTGIELLEKTLQDHPDTVRVILAAYTDEDLLMGAISKVHVHSFLPKPWEPEEVKAVVGEAIKTYEAMRAPERVPGNERKTLAEIMMENGLISREQLNKAMELQNSQQEPGEESRAREVAPDHESGTTSELQLAETLVGSGYVDKKAVILCYALQLGADYGLLSQIANTPELTELLPLKLAYRYSIVPVNTMGHALILAAQKPLSNTAKSELEEKLGRSVIVRAISDV
jgi:class 3 adenylate cyclase/DNA-binding NarL/FixJ family response regulator